MSPTLLAPPLSPPLPLLHSSLPLPPRSPTRPQLWDDSDGLGRSVTVAHLDQLFGMDPTALQSVLPQLVYYVLSSNGPVASEVQAFLLRTSAASHAFGFELYWLLLAQPPRPEPESAANTAQATAHAALVRSLMASVAQTLEQTRAGASRIRRSGEGTPGGGAPSSQFDRQLHLVQTLTAVSEQLRSVPVDQRLQVNGPVRGGGG